jgi:hypothetical protein
MDKDKPVNDIMDRLKSDAQARAEVVKMLARDFPDEFLKQVNVDTSKLRDISAQFISSNKEWQE